MLIGSRRRIISLGDLKLYENGITSRRVMNTKCQGGTIDEYLPWDLHRTNVVWKASSGIGILRRIKRLVNHAKTI